MNDTATTTVAALLGAGKRYARVTALDGVDLEVRSGQLLALLGPNGAGKTTAVSLLMGLVRPDIGRAELFGGDPQRAAIRRQIGVMLQSAQLPPTLRVGELLRLTASYYPRPRPLRESAELAGVEDLLRRPYAALSGGQQRRVQFALALCGQPRLLFLDEPTVGLDIGARQSLWSAVRQLVADGCAVVLTTHYLEEAEALAQRVVVLAHGRVISDGSVDALRSRVAVRRIRCMTTLGADAVRTWPQVSEAVCEDGHIRIATTQAEAVVRRLLESDPDLHDLEVLRPGLAEAFTDLTREVA